MSTLVLAAVLSFQSAGPVPLPDLPIAPPVGVVSFAGAGDFGGNGGGMVIARTLKGVANVSIVAQGVLVGVATPVDEGLALERGVALDLDGDGRASWWAPAGHELVELVLDHNGRFVLGARLGLPGRGVGFVGGGALETELVDGTTSLAAVRMHEGGVVLDPLWIGEVRGIAQVRGGDWLVVDGNGAPWLVHEGEPLALSSPALVRALAAADGAAIVQTIDGALLSIEDLVVTEDHGVRRARSVWRPLIVEGAALDLVGARLYDLDRDGDLDLVKVSGGGIEVRLGWGNAGFLAPSSPSSFGAPVEDDWLGFIGVGERTLLVARHALVPLVGSAEPVTDAHRMAGPLLAVDIDGDGDIDLASLDSIARNDASGAFQIEEVAGGATARLALRRGRVVDFVYEIDGLPWFLHTRADGSFKPLQLLEDLPRELSIASAVAGDFDGDGVDEWSAGGHVFARRGENREWSAIGVAPVNLFASADLDRDGRFEALSFEPARGLVAAARFVEGNFEPAVPIFSLGRAVQLVERLDVDGDGAQDLVFVDGRQVTLVAQNSGTWRVASQFELPFDDVVSIAAPVLFDIDRPTLVFTSSDGRAAFVNVRGALVDVDVRWLASATFADFDGDGDTDLVVHDGGVLIVRGTRFFGDGAGAIVQYGSGAPGSDGLVPLLGVRGPVRVGPVRGELRLRGALGGAQVFLAVTPDDWVLDLRRFGLSTENSPSSLRWLEPRLDGPDGVAGAGTWNLPLSYSVTMAGYTLRAQAFIIDPAAVASVSVSNRIAVTFGR